MTSADIRGRVAERWLWRSSQLPTAINRADGRVAFAATAGGAQEVAAQHRAAWSRSGTARLATIGLSVALAYYVGARLGFLVVFPGSPLSVIWPPNAIVLAALLLVPPRAWWIVLLGVLPAHLVVEWQSGVVPLAVPGLYVTNCGEALLGATLVRRFSGGGPPWLGTLQQVVVYVVGAAIAAPFVASFLDTGVVEATHWAAPQEYWLLWEQRFISAVLTNLTVAPVILVLACGSWRRWRTLPRQRRVEAALLALSFLGSSYVAFSPPTAVPLDTPVLLYLLVPVLLWAAVRFGVGGISASLLAIACLAAAWAHAPGLFVARTPAAAVVTLQLLLIALGAPALCLAALVQERERDAAVLRASQEQYRAVVETQTELITRYRPDLTLTFVNDATCRFMGRTREELLGIPLDADLDAEDSARVRELVQALVARPEQGVLTIEHEAPHRDGTQHWQQWIHRVILDADGRVVELQGIGRDITERKQMEREREVARVQAERQANQLDCIFEAVADALLVHDVEGELVRTNAAARRLLGLDAAPPGYDQQPAHERMAPYLVRDEQGRMLRPDEWPVLRALRGEVVTGAAARDLHLQALDGREFEAQLTAAPLCDRAGEIAGAVCVMHDQTERNRLAREAAAARADEMAARETSRQMEEFLAIAAHDMRNPVLAADGYVQLALQRLERLQAERAAPMQPAARTQADASAPAGARRSGRSDPLQALDESLYAAAQSTERLSRLVTRLFDVARARAGTLELQLVPCNLAALVREQVEAQRVATPDRAILLEMAAAPDLPGGLPLPVPVPVLADVDRLGQVLGNYLTNALKYSSEDAPVTVRLEVVGAGEERLARLAVRDAGLGLPPEEQQRIWEPFHRAPGVAVCSGSTGKAGSLGLGLHICKTIVEGHGGQIGVESAEGAGSMFWFTLPLAKVDETDATEPHASEESGQ